MACSSLLLLGQLAASCGLRCCNAPNRCDVGSFPGQHALFLPLLLKDFSALLILFFLAPRGSSSDTSCTGCSDITTAAAQLTCAAHCPDSFEQLQEQNGCLDWFQANLLGMKLVTSGRRGMREEQCVGRNGQLAHRKDRTADKLAC